MKRATRTAAANAESDGVWWAKGVRFVRFALTPFWHALPLVVVSVVFAIAVMQTLADPAALHLSERPTEEEVSAARADYSVDLATRDEPCVVELQNPDGVDVECY